MHSHNGHSHHKPKPHRHDVTDSGADGESSSNNSVIRLRGIQFSRDSRQVLDGVDLDLKAGARVGLVGTNGSGKTTICRIIMGLIAPDSGSVEIFGKPRRQEADFVDVRQRVGFLFQDADDQLFCPTVLEDVAFGPLNQGKTVDEAKRIVDKTLTTLNLSNLASRFSHQLSGGEKRLVSLATVLAMNPTALILDEPSTGLDVETVERLAEILNSSNLTYLLVSHDRSFLNATTDTVLHLSDGVIQEDSGNPMPTH